MTPDGVVPLFVIALLLPVTYVSIFVHELGHAVMGHAAGFVVTSFGIGTGRPFLKRNVGGVRVFFCRSHPLQGLTFCYIPSFSPSRGRMVAFLAGGILANGLLAIVSLALARWAVWGHALWMMLIYINAFFALSNLVPFQKKVGTAVLRSDGLMMLAALIRSTSVSAPVFIQFVKALRGLWESIGDRLVLEANMHVSAAYWAELGDLERAERDFAEAGQSPASGLPVFAARKALVRAAIAGGCGRLAEAAEAIDSATACLRGELDEVGLLHVDLARIQLLLLQGDLVSASAEIETLAANPRLRSNGPIRIELAAARLAVALGRCNTSEVQTALAGYESMRKQQRSAARDIRIYSVVAEYFTQLEDWQKAAPAFLAAVAAIRETAMCWAEPADAARFLERRSAFLMKANLCLCRVNKAEAAERLVRPLLSIEGFQRRISEAPEERNRRLLRIGLRLMAVDALCAVGFVGAAVALVIYFGPERDFPFVFVLLAFEFMVFTVVAGLYLLFHVTIGRLIPTLRLTAGAVLLILSALPWLSLLMLPLMPFFDRRF